MMWLGVIVNAVASPVRTTDTRSAMYKPRRTRSKYLYRGGSITPIVTGHMDATTRHPSSTFIQRRRVPVS